MKTSKTLCFLLSALFFLTVLVPVQAAPRYKNANPASHAQAYHSYSRQEMPISRKQHRYLCDKSNELDCLAVGLLAFGIVVAIAASGGSATAVLAPAMGL